MQVQVVLQHQALGCSGCRLRLVAIVALRQRQQLVHSLEQALLIRALRRLRNATCAVVDTEARAGRAEGGAVGRLIFAQHFVHELMGHLVLEHLEHDGPVVAQHEAARELDCA